MTNSPSHHHPYDDATFVASLPAELQDRLCLITDPNQRRILLGCLRRGEPIPDFAWRPLADLGQKMRALAAAFAETLPTEESYPAALATLPPGLQRLVEDTCTLAEIERLDGEDEDEQGTPGAWGTLMLFAFLGAFHAAGRGLDARPPQPWGYGLRRACDVDVPLSCVLLEPFLGVVAGCLAAQVGAGESVEGALSGALLQALGGLPGFSASPDWPGERPPATGPLRLAFFLRVAVGLGVDVALLDPASAPLVEMLREQWGRQPRINRFLFEHLVPGATDGDEDQEDGQGEEPLLARYVRFCYPHTPGEGDALAEVVADRLRPFGVAATAAVRGLPLEDWIKFAARAGERMAKENPGHAKALNEEIGEEGRAGNGRVLAGWFTPTGRGKKAAPRPGTAAFTRAIFAWWEHRYPPAFRTPTHLAARCEQIRVLVDGAFWMALLLTHEKSGTMESAAEVTKVPGRSKPEPRNRKARVTVTDQP